MCFDCSKQNVKTVLLCGFIPYMCFSLKLLLLIYWLEIRDVLFLLKHMKLPADNFNIYDHVSFVSSCTRESTRKDLKQKFSGCSTTSHFYWNKLPIVLSAES